MFYKKKINLKSNNIYEDNFKIYIIKNIFCIKWKKELRLQCIYIVKLLKKGCLLYKFFFFLDEMNELVYDLGVFNRVVQVDRVKDFQFVSEED